MTPFMLPRAEVAEDEKGGEKKKRRKTTENRGGMEGGHLGGLAEVEAGHHLGVVNLARTRARAPVRWGGGLR